MRTIDWTADDEQTTDYGVRSNNLTYTAARVLVGHCPECEAVLVVFNDHESWPLLGCSCGWHGDTLSIKNHTRFERGGAKVVVR